MKNPRLDMLTLINYYFKKLGIKIKTEAPYNNHSLQGEHKSRSFTTILTTKHLAGIGQ